MKTIAKQDLFINDEIRVREVRLIGLDGEQLGIKHKEIGAKVLADFAEATQDVAIIEQKPKMDGRQMFMQMAPIPDKK